MLGRVEVFGRVLVGGRVTAMRDAAGLTGAQVHPGAPLLQALDTFILTSPLGEFQTRLQIIECH